MPEALFIGEMLCIYCIPWTRPFVRPLYLAFYTFLSLPFKIDGFASHWINMIAPGQSGFAG